MTQTVFDNAMVAHVWAQRDQSEGRSHNGNFSFRGDTLFSYRTPIGRFVNIDGDRSRYVVLVTSKSYSITTSGKHMPALNRALYDGGYRGAFTVPELGSYYAEGPTKAEHEANLAYLVTEYQDRAAKVQRMRDYYGDVSTLRADLLKLADAALLYAETFKLEPPTFDHCGDARRVFEARAARDTKRNTPAAIAKREADRERREAAKARAAELERAESAERIDAWRNGDPVTLRHGEGRDEAGGALLRVKGATLETSLGVKVPLAEAVRVFRFVKLCRRGDELPADEPNIVWKRNGANVPVGHFQVDWISATGTFRAGCHMIHWPEIERAARAAGVIDAEPSDEAVTRQAA